MGRNIKAKSAPRVNPALEGFDIRINEFGEIISTYDINKLNGFLDANTSDKKFRSSGVERRLPAADEPQPEQVWG